MVHVHAHSKKNGIRCEVLDCISDWLALFLTVFTVADLKMIAGLIDVTFSAGYCGNRYQGNNGTFQSPHYPHPYPPLSSCQWNIHTPVGTRVYLQVSMIMFVSEQILHQKVVKEV